MTKQEAMILYSHLKGLEKSVFRGEITREFLKNELSDFDYSILRSMLQGRKVKPSEWVTE